jgi:hypothetical protein
LSCLYAIVDCAADPRLHGRVMAARDHACLFAGKIDPPLDAAAPWLASFDAGSELHQLWSAEGTGKPWGLLIRSGLPLAELRRHLRKFLQVQLPDGQVVLFRFYDPRVWATYWPTLSDEERAQWRMGITEFVGFEKTA